MSVSGSTSVRASAPAAAQSAPSTGLPATASVRSWTSRGRPTETAAGRSAATPPLGLVPLGGQADGDVGGTEGRDEPVLVQGDDDAGAADRVVALAAGDPREQPAGPGREGGGEGRGEGR